MKVKFKDEVKADGFIFEKNKTYDFPEWIARHLIESGIADGAFQFTKEAEKKPATSKPAKKTTTRKKKTTAKKTTSKKGDK